MAPGCRIDRGFIGLEMRDLPYPDFPAGGREYSRLKMRELRPRQRTGANGARDSQYRGMAPLVAAGTLFLLGLFGLIGAIPLSGLFGGGSQTSPASPGMPHPLVKHATIDRVQSHDLGFLGDLFFSDHVLPSFTAPTATPEPLVVAAGSDAGFVRAVSPPPPTPTPTATAAPPATSTPEPTATPEPTEVPLQVQPSPTPEMPPETTGDKPDVDQPPVSIYIPQQPAPPPPAQPPAE